MTTPEQSQLGKASAYADQYDASLLFPLPRLPKRAEIGIAGAPPFFGAEGFFIGALAGLALGMAGLGAPIGGKGILGGIAIVNLQSA